MNSRGPEAHRERRFRPFHYTVAMGWRELVELRNGGAAPRSGGAVRT
jgi:hypothetical protein